MAWKLRFYSGLNKGVEVPLAQGRVVIGSDPLSADLVVVDSGIAATHVVLDVDAQGVRLLEWAEDCSPTEADLPLTGAGPLQPLAAQRCGPLLWAYCAEGRAFSEQLAINPPREPRVVGSRLKWVGRAMTGGSLLLLISLIGMLGEPWLAPESDTRIDIRVTALHKFLREQHLSHVEVGPTSEGESLSIRGYIEENHQRLTLQRYLEQSGLVFRLEVRSLEEIQKDADFILHKLGHEDLKSANAERPGWILLSGENVPENEGIRKLEEVLKADVPGLLGIEVKSNSTNTPVKRLEQLLKAYGLETVLTYRHEGEYIELSGTLDERQYNIFIELQRQFTKFFGEHPQLKLNDEKRRNRVRKLNLAIRSVSLGRVPYIVLEDNQKYPVGALISGAGRVLSINRDEVVVSDGVQQFVFNVGVGI